MNRERTYKAPVPVCWCRRCRAKTPSEYVDYPEEYERDKICAVCGAVKATEKTDEELQHELLFLEGLVSEAAQ